MVSIDKKSPKQQHSMTTWLIGIPLSLLALVLFILFVQPWGQPRESITSTAPQDGNFYDPTAERASDKSSEIDNDDEPLLSENVQIPLGLSQIVDVNLAAWKPIDEQTVQDDELPDHSDEVLGRELVEISPALWSKVIGDGIQFSIPQREEVLIGTVTKVDANIAQTRILEGILEDGAQQYPFVLTLGAKTTYADINTSTGSFELVGTQNYGWLMESANIAPDVDFSLPDHFFVDPDPSDRVLEPEPAPESSSDE